MPKTMLFSSVILLPAVSTRNPAPPSAAPVKPAPEPPDRAIQMLALLQREGRLVDFISEDIAAYSDDQIGAAVRAVHEGCRAAFDRYLTQVGRQPPTRRRKEVIAVKVAPFHSIKREVHHNDNKCTEGNNIEPENLRQGTGGKPLCHRCAGL